MSIDEAGLAFAHARRVRGAKAHVDSYAVDRNKRDLAPGVHCTTLLRAGEYDLMMVEAPNVPRAEMKNALRWKVKDMVDYPITEATVDFLEIPPEPGAAAGRIQQLYAILAKNELVQERIEQFERAGIPLRVIEVPETAQRNIAVLYEDAERGVALAYFGPDAGLLTITHRGELYLSRRLDVGVEALANDPDGEDGGPLERVALEIQRTLDHFERQFRHVAVGKLLLAPTGRPTRLPEILRARFELRVESIDLTEVLAFSGAAPDGPTQWRLFHHFGAALREGAA
ncbi:MAG TPA: agglutinin biogenesis protein MshI [Burkholderiales bacterium]|nr:agglutinin biogenesis protein MshI [Burkholderiales bacterium]